MTSDSTETAQSAAGREGHPSSAADFAPRPHHYEFAHVALRDTFFARPQRFAVALGTGREELLRRIWADVGDAVVKKKGGAANLPPTGLAVTARRVGAGYLILVSLPAPARVSEAHFVGLAVDKRRFFTLERGLNPHTGQTVTVLCEWRGRRHVNYGAGPEPTVEAFADALTRILTGEEEPGVRGAAELRQRRA